MTQYFYTIPVLLMTLLCMFYLASTNKYILPAHKKGYMVLFSGVFFITICEVVTVILDGSPVELKPLHFLANYFGFLLSPMLIAFFASSIGRFHRLKSSGIGIIAYFVIYNILVITKQMFYIDEQNNYFRGKLFFIYIISYFIATMYLTYESFRYARKGFLQHKIFAYLLCFLFLTFTSVQVFNKEVYLTRLTVVFLSCVYYAYNIEFTNLFDQLTGVLNHGTYMKKTLEIKEKQTVIILDVDDFKFINDNYGHQYGDKCLINVSKILKSVFNNYGQCYRIGGDEFAVILKRNVAPEKLIASFENAVTEHFKNSRHKLTVSAGYAKCEKNDTPELVIKQADFNMYSAKNRKKKLKEE